MPSSAVEGLVADLSDMSGHLASTGQISFAEAANDLLRKSLILSAASYFEQRISDIVLDYVTSIADGNTLVVGLVRSKAIKRQYHTWFDWDNERIGPFQSMFGEDFRRHFTQRLKDDEGLRRSSAAFLEIGRDRNRLVHQNYASFSVEKTSEELIELYKTADNFVEELPNILATCETKALGANVSDG